MSGSKESLPRSADDHVAEAAVPAIPERATAAFSPDPFDPASLRLSQDFAASLGVQKVLLTVPVRKPDKTWFVRVHSDPVFHLETAVIELKEDRETYLVAPTLWPELTTRESTFSPRALFTSVNRQGVLFVWPVRFPGPDGKLDLWSQSALQAAQMAKGRWVRVAANMALGAGGVLMPIERDSPRNGLHNG